MNTIMTVLLVSFFSADNAEFIETSNKQIAEGYTWTYVGMQTPSGDPAITIKPENGNEYILFKLTK